MNEEKNATVKIYQNKMKAEIEDGFVDAAAKGTTGDGIVKLAWIISCNFVIYFHQNICVTPLGSTLRKNWPSLVGRLRITDARKTL